MCVCDCGSKIPQGTTECDACYDAYIVQAKVDYVNRHRREYEQWAEEQYRDEMFWREMMAEE